MSHTRTQYSGHYYDVGLIESADALVFHTSVQLHKRKRKLRITHPSFFPFHLIDTYIEVFHLIL